MILKKKIVSRFSDLRPINLSTFVNKVIFRVIHGRLIEFLPRVISKNQSEFIKGRSIAKNVFLAQDIIRDINKKEQVS